jgi:hypothetical protein
MREAIPKFARIFSRSPNGAPKKLQKLGPDVVVARWGVTTTFKPHGRLAEGTAYITLLDNALRN